MQQFCCSNCSYKSQRKYNLQRHMVMVHGTLDTNESTNYNDSGQNVLLDGQNVLLEGQNVLLDGQNVLLEGQNVLLDGQNVLLEGQNVLLNDNNAVDRKIWNCGSCYKEFTTEKRLKTHQRVCRKVTSALECPFCHKMFSGRNNLSRHRKICHETGNAPQTLGTPVQHTSVNHITNNTSSHITNINNGTINNNHIHVHLNKFGNEDLQHITMEFANECFRMGGYGVQPMIDKIYFDENCPENHNVRLISLKNRLVEVLKDKDQWNPASLIEVLETMLRNSVLQIMSKLDQKIIQPTEEVLVSMNSINNMKSNMKRRIHDTTKGKLVARRKNIEMLGYDKQN